VATQAGADGRVHFAGVVRDPAPYYAAADAFVLPSGYEAFPLTSLEALASGVPILMPHLNGVEDVLDHGRNGWFIDGAESIRARLDELATDDGRAEAMTRSARASAERFNWGQVIEAYDALYRELARTENSPEPTGPRSPRERGAADRATT
jgi:glycosyltransferase involved in cell wall biosynthesis